MFSEKQIKEIREHLEKAQNPLFFFDNDADGLASFLLLRRKIDRGRGVAIKSFPDLNPGYVRKIHELKPDYIFVLDKPIISEGFLNEVKEMNLPFVWIDHHDVDVKTEGAFYYNTTKNKEKSSEPVAYWCHKITDRKEDLWIAMMGCIGDAYLPEFAPDFEKEHPDLWGKDVKTAFQGLYETKIGKITRVLGFALKDRTTNVVRMLKLMTKVKSPLDVLDESGKNTMLKRYNQVNSKYEKLLEKAKGFAHKGRLVYFQYGGELSLSADISNELSYRYPGKVIIVAYIRGAKANVSVRGKKIKEFTLKAIGGIEGATGGGHEDATGAQMKVEDLPKFKETIEGLIK